MDMTTNMYLLFTFIIILTLSAICCLFIFPFKFGRIYPLASTPANLVYESIQQKLFTFHPLLLNILLSPPSVIFVLQDIDRCLCYGNEHIHFSLYLFAIVLFLYNQFSVFHLLRIFMLIVTLKNCNNLYLFTL